MKSLTQRTLPQNLPWILAGSASMGLLAAFVLTLEKFALLADPAHQLSCSINPVLSCGSIILSDQASAFGFPNPLIGLMAFSSLITIGIAMLAGARFKRWFWLGLEFGTIFGIVFVHWLIWQSLYAIGALCLYCMVVWAITWPIFWYSTLYNLREGHIRLPKRLRGISAFVQYHHADILIAWYLLIIVLILENFWYYWQTVV